MGASGRTGTARMAKTAGGVGCRIVPQGEGFLLSTWATMVPLSLNAITAAAQSTVDFPFAIEI